MFPVEPVSNHQGALLQSLTAAGVGLWSAAVNHLQGPTSISVSWIANECHNLDTDIFGVTEDVKIILF